jgi:hypothetical protein
MEKIGLKKQYEFEHPLSQKTMHDLKLVYYLK